MSTYIWAGQEDLNSFIIFQQIMWRNLSEESFQCFTVRLPLSQS